MDEVDAFRFGLIIGNFNIWKFREGIGVKMGRITDDDRHSVFKTELYSEGRSGLAGINHYPTCPRCLSI